MNKFLPFLLLLVSGSIFGQGVTERTNNTDTTQEFYVRNSPTNQIGNSRVVVKMKDSTRMTFDFYNFKFPQMAARSDGAFYRAFGIDADGNLLASVPSSGGISPADTAAMLAGYVRVARFLDSLAAIRGDIGGVSIGGTNRQILRNNAGAIDGSPGFEYGNTNNTVKIKSQNGSDSTLILESGSGASAPLLILRPHGSSSFWVLWNQSGDMSINDRFITYLYGGDARAGWHPTQVGYWVSPGWGYGFSNANNVNVVDASLTRSAAGVVKVVAGGLGVSTKGDLEVLDDPFDATTWNGSEEVPTKNAVRDQFEAVKPTEGTYTPTASNNVNIAASTPNLTNYIRVGDWVHVWGTVDIDATAAATISELTLTIPIGATFGSVNDLAGTASFEDNTTVQIKGDTTGPRAIFRFTPQTATNNKYSFHFSYKYFAP